MLPFVEDDCNNENTFLTNVCEEQKKYHPDKKINDDNKETVENNEVFLFLYQNKGNIKHIEIRS